MPLRRHLRELREKAQQSESGGRGVVADRGHAADEPIGDAVSDSRRLIGGPSGSFWLVLPNTRPDRETRWGRIRELLTRANTEPASFTLRSVNTLGQRGRLESTTL